MENRVLRYFVEMAKVGNMSKAAENLHITQPTMSRQLKDLEYELKVKLFHRTNYNIRLTDEGLLFFNRAVDILNLVDKTKEEFVKKKNSLSGNLFIGCPETDSIRYIARIIAMLRNEGTHICTHLHSGNANDVMERLNKGLDDLIFTVHDITDSKYNILELPLLDQWGILLKKSHPLAMKKTVSLMDIETEPLIVAKQVYERIFPIWFPNERYLKLNISATYNLVYNGALFVMEGLGVCITFRKLISVDNDEVLTFRPLSGVPKASLKLMWKKNRPLTPQASIFLEKLKQEMQITQSD
ncbi:MAG TPA: LysR family transcriptional regulator [Succinivibrionaceae bacterium]|nr:LysR family transcriptional regulator [Succinivibrio sp.]HAR79540.1 LysR family transcriptional regulator [Succinivibrionaceae bacterium]